MNLKDFAFPEITRVDMVFPTVKTNKDLLEEAKSRGFYNGHTPYNDLFSQLFFNGGRIVWKKDVDEQLKQKAWPYCRSFMGSWEPRHEEKEAICALIMSELLEPYLEGKQKKSAAK
jgi:hypothetical protein